MINQKDLDYLLCPYFSVDETKQRWRQYLKDNGKSPSGREMELLAKKLCDPLGNNVPKEAILSLFSNEYIKYTDKPREYPSHRNFKLPCLEHIYDMEFSDTSLIEEIIQRLSYPEGCSSNFGPNNGDLNEKGELNKYWCHEDTEGGSGGDDPERDGGLNHGMYRCTCYIESIPYDFFYCGSCRKKIMWSSHDFYRMPKVTESLGGWLDFYCSKECMMELFDPSTMQTLIIDVAEDCVS